MKIMILAPYIYDKNLPGFAVNKTGFGIMVNDIVNSIAEIADVELLTRVITDGEDNHKKYDLLKHTWKQIIMFANHNDWLKSIRIFFTTHGSIKNRLRKMFYCLDRGYIRESIKKSNPDIVHIHGIGSITKSYIEICEELKQKYIVTLHGLIGLNDSVKVLEEEKHIEIEFLQYADKNNIPVSVVSTGIKKRIEQNYLKHSANNIAVIPNGTYIPKSFNINNTKDIKTQYNLPNSCKICVVIGSILERKNQLQIVEAFAKLDNDVQNNCAIFMCGRDMMEGAVEKRIQELGCKSRIFMLGFISHEDIKKILEVADLNIVASLDEGFGLSIIEAYAYGIPTVIFSDLDAVSDLYNSNTMELVKDRSTIALTEGINKALKRNWNKKEIISYSKNFSLERMAKLYLEFYRKTNKVKVDKIE